MATPARIVPASRGVHWLVEGWRLFRAAPLSWIALAFVYGLLMNLVLLVPLAGILVAVMLMPPFSVGFMAASRAAARGGPVGLEQLFAGFQGNLRGQLALGVVFLACLALLIGATTLIDRSTAQDNGAMLAEMLVALAFSMLVMFLSWFSPVLVAWHGIGAGKSLFFSFLACVLNWRAFLAYGAVTMPVVVAFFAISVSLSGADAQSAQPLLFALSLVMLPILVASFYASYRDIFGTPETA